MGQNDDPVMPAGSESGRDGAKGTDAEALSTLQSGRVSPGQEQGGNGAEAYGDDVEVTVAHIAQTRDEMADTIHEIQHRLTPSHIVSDVTANVKQAASDRIRQVGSKVRTTIRQTHMGIDRASVRAGKIVDRTADTLRVQ